MAIVGTSKAVLEASWGPLGNPLAHLGMSWRRLGSLLGRLGSVFRALRPSKPVLGRAQKGNRPPPTLPLEGPGRLYPPSKPPYFLLRRLSRHRPAGKACFRNIYLYVCKHTLCCAGTQRHVGYFSALRPYARRLPSGCPATPYAT